MSKGLALSILGLLVFAAPAQAGRSHGATDSWSNQLPPMNMSPAGVYGAPASSGVHRVWRGGSAAVGGVQVLCIAAGASCTFWSGVWPAPGTLCHCGASDGVTQ